MATNEQGRRILEFIDSEFRDWLGGPCHRGCRLTALRRCVRLSIRWLPIRRFVADAQAKNFEVMPGTGQEVEAIVKRTLAIPRDDIAAMNALLAAAK